MTHMHLSCAEDVPGQYFTQGNLNSVGNCPPEEEVVTPVYRKQRTDPRVSLGGHTQHRWRSPAVLEVALKARSR